MDLSIHQGHNSSVSFFVNGEYYIIELEKLSGLKNMMLIEQSNSYIEWLINQVYNIIRRKYDYEIKIDTLLLGKDWPQVDQILIDVIKPKEVKFFDHHVGHAYCSFYQSDFETATIVSYDGGGNDGFINFFHADKTNGIVKLNKNIDINLGVPYYRSGYPISEIRNKTGTMVDDLKIAGKLMGLVGYGQLDSDFYKELMDFYYSYNFFEHFRGKDTLSDKESFNYAHTSQKVFEKLFLHTLFENFDILNIKSKNICLAGGCALNVLMNQILIDKGFNVFVPPNPDDGGLSLGFLMEHRNEKNKHDITFNGIPIIDKDNLPNLIKKRKYKEVNISELVSEIISGKIVGIIEGDSEVGPRALGRRSIICNPTIPGMKDILNNKVKFREWFRPFAPVVRDIDAKEYFEVNEDLEKLSFMSFAPFVKEKYREVLPSITHVDGTSRLQVVSDKNETFYKILDEMERQNQIPVMINTSFNTKGKPNLTSYEEAFQILDTTELDYVYSNGFLFYK